MPSMPNVSETSNEAKSTPVSSKTTKSTTSNGVCTEKCIQDESETWLYKCKHEERCGGCKHCHLCESWCEAHTNEWHKKCKNIQCKACNECHTTDAVTNVTQTAMVETSPDTTMLDEANVTVEKEQQQPVTPTKVKDEKVEPKKKQTETAEPKDVTAIETEMVEPEPTNDTAIETETEPEQSTGNEENQSSTKAISSPTAPTSTSSASPSPTTSASITTTVIEPPQDDYDYDYDTDLMLVGEHCLYNTDCESNVCNTTEKKKKNRVCLSPEPTTRPTSVPTEEMDVVEDGEHCIYDEECRSGDCSDGKKRQRICLSVDTGVTTKETPSETASEQPTVNEKVDTGGEAEEDHGMETETGGNATEDTDMEVETNGDYFDDDGTDNEYEPINEEHDGSEYNATENDTTKSPPETTAPLGGSYCTYSPDYDCYSRGWPDCCWIVTEACPVTRPVCDANNTVEDEDVTGDADDAAMTGITNNPSVSGGVRIPPTPYHMDVNDTATNLENEEQPQQQTLSVSPTVSPSVLANDKNDSINDSNHPGHAASSPHKNEQPTTLRPSNAYTPSPVIHQQYAIRSREPTVPTPYRTNTNTFLPTLFEPPQTNIVIDQIPAQPEAPDEGENWEETFKEELSEEVEKAEEDIIEIHSHGGSFLSVLTLCLFVGAGFVYLRERRRRRAWRRGFRHGDMATGSDTFTFRAVGRSSSGSDGSVGSGGNPVRRRMD